MAVGTATVDFGSTPVDNATFNITDAALSGLTYAEAFWMRESTAQNSVDEHETLASWSRLICSITGTTLTVYCELLAGFVTGQFKLRYAAD
jgi:hypothetical protein